MFHFLCLASLAVSFALNLRASEGKTGDDDLLSAETAVLGGLPKPVEKKEAPKMDTFHTMLAELEKSPPLKNPMDLQEIEARSEEKSKKIHEIFHSLIEKNKAIQKDLAEAKEKDEKALKDIGSSHPSSPASSPSSFIETSQKSSSSSAQSMRAEEALKKAAKAEFEEMLKKGAQSIPENPFDAPSPAVALLADLKAQREKREKRKAEMDAKKARGEDPGLFFSSFLESSEDEGKKASMEIKKLVEAQKKNLQSTSLKLHELQSQLNKALGSRDPNSRKGLGGNGGMTDHYKRAVEKIENLKLNLSK